MKGLRTINTKAILFAIFSIVKETKRFLRMPEDR
jgi:hypothetical protein